MTIKPIETTPTPNYPDKYAEQIQKELTAARIRRWRSALVSGVLAATLVTGLSGCELERVIMGEMPVPTPSHIEYPTAGIAPMPTPYVLMGDPAPIPTPVEHDTDGTFTQQELEDMEAVDAMLGAIRVSADYLALSPEERAEVIITALEDLVAQGLVLEGSVKYNEGEKLVIYKYFCGISAGEMVEEIGLGGVK